MKKNFTLLLMLLGLFLVSSQTAKAQTETVIFQENFASLTMGNSTTSTGSGTAWTGNENFPTVDRAYQAGEVVKLGTGSYSGSITSVPLDLSVNEGNFKIMMKVKGWSKIEGTIKLTVGSLDPQTLTYTATMANAFEEIEAEFTGGTADMTVKIETSAKRAFIDDVKVYYGGSTLSNDADLATVSISETDYADFLSTQLNYYVTLTTTDLPVLTATASHAGATVDVTNVVTIPGISTIKVTAENGTSEKVYTFYWSREPMAGDLGSKTNPYTVAQALDNQLPVGTTTKYWVKGYIVGAMKSSGLELMPVATGSNIVLADTQNDEFVPNLFEAPVVLLPVELPTGGAARTGLNLVDNPVNYNKEVIVYGTLETYFSMPGFKGTSEYELSSTVGINPNQVGGVSIFSQDGSICVNADASVSTIEIYNILGQKVATIKANDGLNTIPAQRGQVYIVKAGTKTAKVVL